MVIVATVPSEDVDIRVPAWGIDPLAFPGPVAVAGRDIEGRIASWRG